ncbi:SLC13 family permease [Mahella australiensis]|uniref:Citrate transporter n=1 Tax=Mahella australiensis (strain DSM 15567 / CIP 107919 / 50-1 BON) TaxID=697281 RepID=F3ZX20_MAHA5|nr:SLC13 family permease [Mahella australiensis]AEE95469.1 Citrate transporter [Mahella australiensis 50-1 BON]
MTIFVVTYALIISEKIHRSVIGIIGALVLIVFGILSFEQAIDYINWETIGLLMGMFTLVALLSEAGFFSFMALWTARLFHYKARLIFIAFPVLAALLAAFMDSVTVTLFLTLLTLRLCRLFKTDPVPFVIAEVMAANVGGAATLVGDPPNVIIGTIMGYSFSDFATNTGPIVIVAISVLMFYLYFTHRSLFGNDGEDIVNEDIKSMNPVSAIKSAFLLRLGLIAFAAAVAGLILKEPIKAWFGVEYNSAVAALLPASIALAFLGEHAHRIIDHLDYDILLFFMALFVIVGGLEATGAIEVMARWLVSLAGGSALGMIFLLLFGTGITSAVVDNVPLALAMAYIIKSISQAGGLALPLMVWTLALGVDIGGNMTPIGASANVVAYSLLKSKDTSVSWAYWLKEAVIPTLLVLGVCYGMLLLKLYTGWY